MVADRTVGRHRATTVDPEDAQCLHTVADPMDAQPRPTVAEEAARWVPTVAAVAERQRTEEAAVGIPVALAAVVVTHLLLAEEAVATHQLPAVEVAVGMAVDKV